MKFCSMLLKRTDLYVIIDFPARSSGLFSSDVASRRTSTASDTFCFCRKEMLLEN